MDLKPPKTAKNRPLQVQNACERATTKNIQRNFGAETIIRFLCVDLLGPPCI